MSNKMLIDATHPEETRVVVLRGNRVEEFDFEAADRQQLRGNIYLAKVTRVEPSLQAAFVDYGGNRHGFLAFSEIHPDYYQIPFADRQALLQEQAREDEEEEAEEAAAELAQSERATAEVAQAADAVSAAEADFAEAGSGSASPEAAGSSADGGEAADREVADPEHAEHAPDEHDQHDHAEQNGEHDHDHPQHDVSQHVESVGAEDALEEVPERRKPRPRQYKIQEVIKRRQVLLVQVVKEERGNKGAALTTYLSLAGRYSVLMPNTGRGGGISRKITNLVDRKRLKAIASELDVPEGMGVILRTAGANRTKAEVKRDFEYLLRLWENVRELTLRSSAPKLVYEEGSLIKRSIRDLYSREIEQVVVAGDDAYREAKDFMRMLMPSHARNVQQYRDDNPLFARNGVEAQLDAMFSPQVTLRSGGYIVINQTEALVAIDVNSGRSTREHSIEDTALNTNLEAAEEIARQLRLRDLAGLIVIDFIDMEENRNNRAVERKLKDCLRADRARIQVGRISHFGLMEMSRQRIRTGVLESSTVSCPHCRGTGQVRSVSSLSLQILRALEDNLLRHGGYHLYVRTRPEVALYVLNQKRRHLAQLEGRFGLSITVTGDVQNEGAGFAIERGARAEDWEERPAIVARPEPVIDEPEDPEELLEEQGGDEEFQGGEDGGGEAREGREPRRRRRRRRGGNGEDRADRSRPGAPEDIVAGEASPDVDASGDTEAEVATDGEDEASQEARRRRRGRRGGRRRGRAREDGSHPGNGHAYGQALPDDMDFAPADPSEQEALGRHDDGPQPRAPSDFVLASDDEAAGDPHAEEVAALTESAERHQDSGDSAEVASALAAAGPESGAADGDGAAAFEGTARPDQPRDAEPAAAEAAVFDAPREPEPAAQTPEPVVAEIVQDNAPKRSGWWNRKSFF